MSTNNYTFQWIGPLQWRLTSRVGMEWEGEISPDISGFKQNNHQFVNLSTMITKGDNSIIPVNGVEKISFHTKRMIINGIEQLSKALYNKM